MLKAYMASTGADDLDELRALHEALRGNRYLEQARAASEAYIRN